MEIKKIKNTEEYRSAVSRMEAIGDQDDLAENKTLLDEFEKLSALVMAYEQRSFPLDPGHPLVMIKLKMDSLDIRQKDLVPLIGSSGVVSEVFNRKRGLSKDMIREFAKLLHIDQELLNLKYDLQPKSTGRSLQQTQHRINMDTRVAAFRQRVLANGMVFNMNNACL